MIYIALYFVGFGSPPRVWGKLAQWFLWLVRVAVHPHVCGENWRVRHRDYFSLRFTPTCVGKTQHAAPAARGVHGSPPRVWGKR